MLSINMSDVIAVVKSIMPQLITIGVVLLLALIVTFAVNKKTVSSKANRKMIHSQSWIVFLIAAVAAIVMMVTGPLSTLISNATAPKYMLSEATVKKANDLAKNIQREGVTLLENNDQNLPLANKKVNVFG